MNWKAWLQGLLAAAISGTATTVGAYAGTAMTGNALDLKATGGAALGGAVVGAVMYLKQSPIPANTPSAK